MIINLTDLKLLLGITSTTDDTFILKNMPIIEESICKYCNNDFIDDDFDIYYSSDFVFSTVDNSISLADIGEDLIAGDTIRIYESHRNNRALSVKTVSLNKIIIDSDINIIYPEANDESIILTKVNYPDDLQMPFAQMMYFTMQKYNVGIKSEKIDDYSITYDDLINGYPKSIMSGLQGHRQLFKPYILDDRSYCNEY